MMKGTKTAVIDLHGRFVLPGFNDAHVHLASGGMTKLRVNLEGSKSLEEMKARIAEAAKRIVGELGIPGLKHALDYNGYYGGTPRLPLLPPTAGVKAEVEHLLANIRN
ncbi:MAG: amidohydrolase family protein [Terriglobales bacterium]